MFSERRKDRRRSYSFQQHFKRAIATKGVRRVLAPMVGTAIVASVAFAYCGSDAITGPSSQATQGPAGTPQTQAMVTKFPVAITEFPVEVTVSCGGDVLEITKSTLNGTGTLTVDGSGGVHTQLHVNHSFHAVGTVLQPIRRYSGSQDYDYEQNLAGNTITRMDFEMHVISRAEHDPAIPFPGDDLIMHTNMEFKVAAPPGLPPTVVPFKANSFTKCQ